MVPQERDRPPAADNQPDPALFLPDPGRARRPVAQGLASKRCVLVVDDSTMMRRMVSVVVLELGHQVLEAADGDKALELARQHEPDLVVLDVNMPERDGLAVLRQLRAEPRLAATPVIMLTVESGREVIARALSGKASEYLVKPVSTAELRKRISRYLP